MKFELKLNLKVDDEEKQQEIKELVAASYKHESYLSAVPNYVKKGWCVRLGQEGVAWGWSKCVKYLKRGWKQRF